jgi:UDP-GlcNAc:undecaprenyl-phosphate GlcNAc-1-phosphate transferase
MNDVLAQHHLLDIMKYVCVLLAGFVTTFVLTPLVISICPRVGWMDVPREDHIHKRTVPRCGLSLFAGFHAACAIVFLVPWTPFRGQMDLHWWWRFLTLSSMLMAVGLVDDRWELRAWMKLLGQILIASLAFGFDMRVGRLLGFVLPTPLDYLATVLWFLTIINAFNLIDGIDGLATGLASIACIGIAGSFLFRHVPGDALILFGLLGACVAFLRYNFYPAKIFLGDSGSMFLGFTLACVAVSSGSKGTTLASVFVPLLAIGVPLFDTILAVWRRTVRRALKSSNDKHVFQRDTDHVHHRLIKSGLSHAEAATWLYAISAVLVGVGLLSLLYRSHALGIYILAFVTATYVVVRHLARVELWDSGLVIMRGLHAPRSKVIAVLLYPVLDIMALSLALGIASFYTTSSLTSHPFKLHWFDQIPLWVGLPFLCMFAFRTYARVWSRARASEYVILSLAVASGILIAATLGLISGSPTAPFDISVFDIESFPQVTVVLGRVIPRGLSQQTLMYAGLAIPLVVGLRALPHALKDAMAWAQLRREADRDHEIRMLVYGAGLRSTLFLREQVYEDSNVNSRVQIVGMLDDDSNLHGRLVYGYRVLGGIEMAATILQQSKVNRIVITEQLEDSVLKRLKTLARANHAELTVWQTVHHSLVTDHD